MATQRILGVMSLACALAWGACDEEERDPARDVDSGEEPVESADAGGKPSRHDAGADPSTADDTDDAESDDDDTGDAGAAPPDAQSEDDDPDSGSDGGADSDDPSAPMMTDAFFLPTEEPDNTSAPTVEVDAQGNVHSVYPAYAGGDAYYSLCANDGSCKGSESAKVVHFQTEGTVANAMLALTADGKPRVLLSSFQHVYWAECDEGCGERENWTFASILDHGGKRQITGEALALDPSGRPRFLMHTYRALFGIGQETPEEIYAQCDANCENPASWRYDVVENEIWDGSNLRFDAHGHAHVATTVVPFEGLSPQDPLTAYLACEAADCGAKGAFRGIGFFPPFESMTEAITMNPATALALTRDGAPRVALIAKSSEGKKQLVYFACDQDCQKDTGWSGTILTEHSALGSGLDLALDATDHPRLVYTFNYNILLRHCDGDDCTSENAPWDDALVEASRNIPPDHIFLWENCTIGAWFLHDPSIALTREGLPRVGYQARDISGGFTRPDPTKPGCVPGTDMTFARLARMQALD